MRTEVIKADTIDGAVEQILEELKDDDATSGTARSTTSGGRRNVIYFDGWDGLGASAVLRAVGTGWGHTPLSQVIYVDCSKWESRRAAQRALAKQLELPAPVVAMLDAKDEEDDYQGVDKGSRAETPQVAGAICQHIQKLNRRFLVIFLNGSSEEIDLDSLGFPLSGYLGNKVLWSFQGRFRLYPRTKVDGALKSTGTTTDVMLSAASSHNNLSHLLDQEAAEVASEIGIGGVQWSAAATSCFLYMVKLYDMGSRLVDYDLATHGCNYWKCDGIVELEQGEDVGTDEGADRLWLSCDALQREMRIDAECYKNPYLSSPLTKGLPEQAYWTSPTYGFMLIPSQIGWIPNGMFQHFDKLCVLKLSACMFSLISPPFLCCHNLRFLWIDHCRPLGSTDRVVGKKEEDIRQCFQRLWVLDVRCSKSAFLSAKMIGFMIQLGELNVMDEDWLDMDPLQGRLQNIRRFRVTKSCLVSCTDRPEDLFSGMSKLELLEFSGNYAPIVMNKGLHWLFVGSSCSSLETVIIDGSASLQHISLTGCVKLKNLFLSGSFPSLCSLDITGSAVKTLDLSTVTAPNLDKLILLDCSKLCAILWPPEDRRRRYLGELHVGTTPKEGTAAGDQHTGMSPPPTGFNWYISVRDSRLLGSLVPVKDYFGRQCAHLEISTIPSFTRAPAAVGSKDNDIKGGGRQQVQVNVQQQMLKDNAIYPDICTTLNALYEDEGDCDALLIKCCICPPPPCVPSQGCYMHIEDQMRAGLQAASVTIPGFICDSAKILHMHDSLFVTSILADPLVSTTWNQLEWCRVERCPNLECVISSQNGVGLGGHSSTSSTDMFKKLRTIWASHLPNTRYIWSWSVSAGRWDTSFVGLTLLHLDYCPRLIYVTQLAESAGMESLEILEIMWCGDLSMVFKGSANWRQFPNLKRIHLHELPKLQGICDVGCRIHAPNLLTIKIRGCWNLKTLPYAGGKNVVECDCEKEWWDRLEWDPFVEPNRQYYKPTHPRHYKTTMLRPSVLR